MAKGTWILEKGTNDRFPYRLQVIKEGKLWVALRAQDQWPAAGKNIFCLREIEPPVPEEAFEEVERCGILAFNERGPRVSVVLDRKRYKRCDFLFLKKPYKNKPGESYEQIFWLTQRSIEQHRSPRKLALRQEDTGLQVRIHGNEKYPWSFPGAVVTRGPIATGDYALMRKNKMLAVVERKTLDNLLHDFNSMPVLHQRLAELAVYRNHAFVIEAAYTDFLNPKKVHHYTPAFCARAIAELHALHSDLHIVYCDNRKMANEWTKLFFAAVWNMSDIAGK